MRLSLSTCCSLLTVLIQLLITIVVSAQIPSRHITVEDGLSQGMVMDMVQDHKGFVWIGTKNGLNRYDGVRFVHYRHDPQDRYSLPGNTVTALALDLNGRLWVGTEEAGIAVRDPETGRFHRISISHDVRGKKLLTRVSSISRHRSGTMIVGVASEAAIAVKLGPTASIDSSDVEVVPIELELSASHLQAANHFIAGITATPDGEVYILCEVDLFRYDATSRSAVKVDVRDIKPVHHGMTLLDAWKRRVNHVQNNAEALLQAHTVPWPDLITGVENLDYGTMLMGWDSLRWVQDEKVTAMGFGDEQRHMIYAVMQDASGQLWVGTSGYGIYILNMDGANFEVYNQGLSFCSIAEIDGEVVGMDFATYWYDNDGAYWDKYIEQEQEYLNTIVPLDDGGVFVRTYHRGPNLLYYRLYDANGALRFDENLTFSASADQRDPHCLTESGYILIGGVDYVVGRIDPKQGKVDYLNLKEQKITKQVNPVLNKGDNRITSIYEDALGGLWIGTLEGAMHIENWETSTALDITWYRAGDGPMRHLSYNHVSAFLDDPRYPNDYLWVATKGGGLNRLERKSGKVLSLSTDDGLPNEVVYGLLADEEGRIWGSTNKGLFAMEVTTSAIDTTYQFTNFTMADGLPNDEFNTGAYKVLEDGRLAFGGIRGICIFDPDAVLASRYNPPVAITGIALNNSTSQDVAISSNGASETAMLELDHDDDVLQINYASLDYRRPDHIRYRYRMEGLGDEWIEAEHQTSATFINLPAGTYTFTLQGTNSRQQWSEGEASLALTIAPPWYATFWAYGLYILTFCAVLTAILWQYRRRQILRQQVVAQRAAVERQRELDETKTRLFTNLTHEFRTPLTIIIGMSQQLAQQATRPIADSLQMIQRNGESLLQMVNRMLELAKLTDGNDVMDPEEIEIIAFIGATVDKLSHPGSQKGVNLHYLPDSSQYSLLVDGDKLDHILVNLINNAVKFTPRGGHVYVKTDTSGVDNITVKVIDTGVGIAQKYQSLIFERFYQVEDGDSRSHEGSGLGLSLCRELVHRMNGQITVESPVPGQSAGTAMTVVLPITALESEVDNVAIDPVNDIAAVDEPIEEQDESSLLLPTVLIVEDHDDVATYIATCLPDCKTVRASHGREGLIKARELVPDLIITDLMMPEMDGYEMTQALHRNDVTSHIPIIMLTAKVDADSKIRGLEHGAISYISKPFDPGELALVVDNLLRLRAEIQRQYQDHSTNVSARQTEVPADDTPLPRSMSKRDRAFISRVEAVIEAHLSDDSFTVSKLCDAVFLSHSQLGRKVLALTGLTPRRLIQRRRLQLAQRLLRETDDNISLIADRCGYTDPSHFARAFKSEYSMTASEWRK